MIVYYLLLFLIIALAWPLCEYRPSARKKAVYLCAVFGFMLLLSILREGIGNDYWRYIEMFDLARQPMGADVTADIGFELILRVLVGVGLSNRAVFAVLAVGCLAPVAWFIYRYSPNVWLSAWLYVTLTFFYGTLNFIRQNLALSVLLLAYPLLKKRSWRARALYLLVVAAAFFIHSTVIVMVPVMLLLAVPLNRYTVTALAAAGAMCVAFARPLLNIFALRADGEYYFLNYHVDKFYLVGLRPLFVALPLLFAVLVLAALPALRKARDDADLLAVMLLFSAFVWSFVTQFFILERFSLFTYAYALIALPAVCETLRPKELQPAAVSGREQAAPAKAASGAAAQAETAKRAAAIRAAVPDFAPAAAVETTPAASAEQSADGMPAAAETTPAAPAEQPAGGMPAAAETNPAAPAEQPADGMPAAAETRSAAAEEQSAACLAAAVSAETHPAAPPVNARRSATRRALAYCAAVAVLLAVTFAYNRFGMTDGSNGFHGDFPYRSFVPWLDNLP